MKLEQQVPSLSLCKKLKSLSYPQEGLFWHGIGAQGQIENIYFGADKRMGYEYIVAPTVAEMLNVIDSAITLPRGGNIANYLAEILLKNKYLSFKKTK